MSDKVFTGPYITFQCPTCKSTTMETLYLIGSDLNGVCTCGRKFVFESPVGQLGEPVQTTPPWILAAAQEIEEHVRAKCNRYVMHANEIAAIIARHLPPAP